MVTTAGRKYLIPLCNGIVSTYRLEAADCQTAAARLQDHRNHHMDTIALAAQSVKDVEELAAYERAAAQRSGSNSSSRWMEWCATRERTSRNQADGSTFTNSQDATKLRNTAIVRPLRSLPQEYPVAAPNRDPAQRALRVVVDWNIAVFQVARQRSPVLQQVRYGLARVAFGQQFLTDLQQVDM